MRTETEQRRKPPRSGTAGPLGQASNRRGRPDAPATLDPASGRRTAANPTKGSAHPC